MRSNRLPVRGQRRVVGFHRGDALAGALRIDAEGGRPLDAIGWSLGPRLGEIDMNRPLDLAFRLERDEYQGISRLQLRIVDFRHA